MSVPALVWNMTIATIRNWIYEIKSLQVHAMPRCEMHQLKDHEIDPAERFRAKG